MKVAGRIRCAGAAGVVLLLTCLPFRLEGQGARAILQQPGTVNASVDGSSWWLANQSVVVTWSTAGGGIRLASVFDRLGGRTGPKPGETFTVTLPGGGSLGGSAFRLSGRPSVADLPLTRAAADPAALKPGKQISARLASPDGSVVVEWRASLRAGDDLVRQVVTIESGTGEAAAIDIAMTGPPRAPRSVEPAPAAGVLAGPYLQSPGPSSVTVMWVTASDAAGWVEYGRDDATTAVFAVRDGLVDANTRVHRVTLTGLTPDTPYAYRIVTRPIVSFGPYKVDYGDIARSEPFAFRTLGPARQSYSFLVLNDLHENVETMRAQMGRAAAEPYDFVFFNGDSLSHLETEAQVLDRCLKPASELFASRAPLFLVRGNHETRGAFARDLGRYLALPDGRYYYAFDHGPVHFIVMDTGEDKEDGHWAYSGLTDFDAYRAQEAEWLAREVASPAFTQARFRVLVAHMPFFGNQRTRVDGHGPADARTRWGAILNLAGLDLHIAGHTHRADWVEATAGANTFPVAVGGGSAKGSNTLTRVNVSPDALEVIVTTDAGVEVSRHMVPARAPAVRAAVARQVEDFDLKDVRLLDGPFREAMRRDQQYLLALDQDRLLHNFRVTAGLPSAAAPLGGWEAPDVELRGHSAGHYLTALALMYASTGDTRFKERADAMVAELAKVQTALAAKGFNAGYLSAFPEELIDRVEARQRVWAPYYTLHKIMAGLLDVHLRCGNAQALAVVTKMAAWVQFRMDRLAEEQQQRMLDTEFGGMNDVLAELYAVTGNPDHLRMAQAFNHKAIFEPLERREDRLDGLHGNTQFPKIIGAVRQYELTGDRRLHDLATYFWERVALHRSFAIGGNTDDESFFPAADFSKHLGESSTETCNTYNMLKLTRQLFRLAPTVALADFYERGLFNHILASQDPATGMMCYYVPLKPGAFKTYSTPDQSFWCCVGTGMENHAKYPDSIYFHDDAALYVNLFIASELNWRAKGLVVRQETRFPESDTTRLTFTASTPVRTALKIRYPGWAKSGITLVVNGKTESVTAGAGSYVTVDREWKTGDTVEVKLPMTLRLEAMPDDPNVAAVLYGPIVLAGDLGREGLDSSLRYGPSAPPLGKLRTPAIPAFVGDPSRALASIEPVQDTPLTFRTKGLAQPHDVTLVPFFKAADQRYTVYWKLFTPAQWEERKADAAATEGKRQAIERNTIDFVDVSSEQSERDHGYTGERTSEAFLEGRKWRDAREGWFSYDVTLGSGGPVSLVCTYRGSEGRRRVHDILVDGETIATETMYYHPTETYDVTYALPEALVKGKSRITVRFQAAPGASTGGVLDVRTVRRTAR